MNCFLIAKLIIKYLATLEKITLCRNSFSSFCKNFAKIQKTKNNKLKLVKSNKNCHHFQY